MLIIFQLLSERDQISQKRRPKFFKRQGDFIGYDMLSCSQKQEAMILCTCSSKKSCQNEFRFDASRLMVKSTSDCGKGVFATGYIPSGARILEYVGVITERGKYAETGQSNVS